MTTLLQEFGTDTTFSCPLCKWEYTHPPQAIARPHVRDQIERQIHDHLSQHPIADWMAKLRAVDTPLLSRLIDMRESDRIRLWQQLDEGGIVCPHSGHHKDHGVCYYCMGRYGK